MTPIQVTAFQAKFIRTCLDSIEKIISGLEAASQIVTANSDNSIHLDNITDASNWTKEEITRFSSAVWVALKSAFEKHNTLFASEEITEAKKILFAQLVPELTANTKANDRLNSVKENIISVKQNIKIQDSLYNRYFMFSVITAGVIITGMACALALTKK